MASDTNNPLLQPVPHKKADEYYIALLASLKANGIEIRPDAGGGRGKGVFASKGFQQGDVLWMERPLAAVQQLDSKLEVSTCSHCFRAVGTVEQHFGGKICCLINELSDATEEDDLREVQDRVNKIQAAVNSQLLEGLLQGLVSLPLTDRVDMAEPVKCRGGCGEEFCSPICECEAWERYHCLLCPVGATAETTSSSSDERGKGKVPAASQQLPACSHANGSSSSGSGSNSAGPSSSSSSSRAKKPATQQVHGVTVTRAKLGAFFEHADETNDIFRVAAQVVASTLLTADSLLQQAAADAAEAGEAGAAYARAISAASTGERTAARVVTPADAAAAADDDDDKGAGNNAAADKDEQQAAAAAFARAAGAAQPGASQQQVVVAAGSAQQQQQQWLEVLQAAFLPFAVAHKVAWWELVAAQQEESEQGKDSNDDDSGSGSERLDAAELRAQLRELAADSLALLRAGLQDERFPQLFDLQLYGSLVGMFELNNLALTVPAPVARYKDMLLHPAEFGVDADAAAAALREVTPLLDALGHAADTPAEGTGFYALQSCVNHSCAPNAAATCLPNGQMVVRALGDIPTGSEVLLSYIEEEGAGLQERRAMLRDYGFVCACQRCSAEELAGVLEQQQLVAA